MNKYRLGILTGSHAVNDLYQGMVPALLPLLMLERGYTYTQATGLVLAANGISSIVQPVFGVYSDGRNRSWLVPMGFLLAALGVVLAIQGTNYSVTWLAIALSGVGIAAYHPPATVAARAAGGTSQTAISIFSVGGTLGAACAPLLVSVVADKPIDSRMALLAAPALAMAAIWFFSNRSAEAETLTMLARNGATIERQNNWKDFSFLVAIIVLWSIPYVAVMSTISLHFIRSLGAPQSYGATALTVFLVGDALGTLIGGWLADARGRIATIRIGYILMLPSLAGIVWAPSPSVAIICCAVFGMAMFIPFASKVTIAQDLLPKSPATASGIALGLALSAGGLASPFLGMIADDWGLVTMLASALIILGAAGLLAFWLRDPLTIGAQAGLAEA